MSFFDINVLTSFGAFGRSKILLGHAGTVLVTKDCSQLLQNTSSTDPLSKMILSIINRHSNKYGDGGMTLALLFSSAISSFGFGGISVAQQDVKFINIRAQTLRCIENIINVFYNNMDYISSRMIEAKVWFECDLDLNLFRNMCLHILVPATNSDVARNLTNIVVAWLSMNVMAGLGDQYGLRVIEYALQHFDDVVLPSGVGTLPESYTSPPEDVFIEGKCLDESFLRTQKHMTLKEQASPQLLFVCVRKLVPTPADAHDSDSDGDSEDTDSTSLRRSIGPSPVPILQMNSLSMLGTPLAAGVGLDSAVRAIHLLRGLADQHRGARMVVFCGDSMDSTLQFIANTHCIVIVDGVSAHQLSYLADRAEVELWDNSRELLQAKPIQVQASVGRAQVLEVVQMLPNEAPLLRLKGLVATTRSSQTHRGLPLQLVMRGCMSVHIRGIYRRLVKRCLVAVGCVLRDRRVKHRASEGDVAAMRIICAHGGGTNELVWSILWDEICGIVDGMSQSPHHSVSCTHTSPFCELTHHLATALLQAERNRGKSSTPTVQLVSLCRQLSKAYFLVPVTLVGNRLSANVNTSDVSRRVRRVTLDWKSQLRDGLRGGQPSAIQDIAFKMGLLILQSNPSATDSIGGALDGNMSIRVSFPVQGGIAGFHSLLEVLRLYMRIGGPAGVVKVKTLKSVQVVQNDCDV